MDKIVFTPESLDSAPEKSFLLEFPSFSLSLLLGGGEVYAEIIEGSSRKTFKGVVKDNEGEIKELVDKVMEKLDSVIRLNHNQ